MAARFPTTLWMDQGTRGAMIGRLDEAIVAAANAVHLPVNDGRDIRDVDLLAVATETGVVEQKGSWYYYQGEALGNGKEVTKNWLADHPEVMEQIRQEVLNGE